MKILLDAMGGDNGPDANIKGAVRAINQIKAEVILIGKEEVIKAKLKEFYGKTAEEISTGFIFDQYLSGRQQAGM
jgi:fatty acid/phospholipid biosynthesis enzyme